MPGLEGGVKEGFMKLLVWLIPGDELDRMRLCCNSVSESPYAAACPHVFWRYILRLQQPTLVYDVLFDIVFLTVTTSSKRNYFTATLSSRFFSAPRMVESFLLSAANRHIRCEKGAHQPSSKISYRSIGSLCWKMYPSPREMSSIFESKTFWYSFPCKLCIILW